MPQTPEDRSHSGEAAQPPGHEKPRCPRKSAAHRYRWNCCSCEVLSPCADRDRSRGSEEVARPPSSYDKPSSEVAAMYDETSPFYSGEIVAATYGQPWGSHPQCHDSKVTGSDNRTPASLSVTSLTDPTFHSGKAVTKSKEWIQLDETQKLCSMHSRSSKFVATHKIKKQWSYDEQATRSVVLPGSHLISSKHTYIPDTRICATGKSLSQLHTDIATSSDMSHNKERECVSSQTVISKGLSCSELISTQTEMAFSESALSAELLDIEKNDLSHTNYNDQISSEFSGSSSDFINSRQTAKSDSSVLEGCSDSGKVCTGETTSLGDRQAICHDLEQVSDNQRPGPDTNIPCKNYSEKHTDVSGTDYVMNISEGVEPEIILKNTEYKSIVEHVPSSSKLLTNKTFAMSNNNIVNVPEIPFEKEVVEKVLSNSQITQNIIHASKEHVATSTEEPRSENVATITDQPKSENVGTSTEQPRREHVATSTKRAKKEHVATITEQPHSEHVATSTERPRSRSVATSTDEPFIDVATSTDGTQTKHAATSIQSSLEDQDTAVTQVESETQTPSEKRFRNRISRTDSNDLPYDDHALSDNSDLVVGTDMTHGEDIVTVTDKSELDEENDDSSLQELESNSDELPSTGQTSCFPF